MRRRSHQDSSLGCFSLYLIEKDLGTLQSLGAVDTGQRLSWGSFEGV